MSSSLANSNLSDAVRLDITGNDLFGRETETAILNDALERICCSSHGKPELVLVGGISGTGKTCLVNTTLKTRTLDEKEGFFIHGKFDQFSEGVDFYAALTEALNELCAIIEHRNDCAQLVQSIQDEMGDDAVRLSSFIPGLCDLLSPTNSGCAAAVLDEESASSYDRFAVRCCSLIQLIARIDRPIVLFLDDLQWGDTESLKLVQHLLTTETMKGLLIVGTYRDDEVTTSHILPMTAKKVAATATNVRITKVIVGCLSEASVNELLAFATELNPEVTAPLSKLIHHKTDGNCFFVHQFLEMLQDDRLLRYSFVVSKWEWQLDEIAAKTNVSENVVDLVVDRIDKLDLLSQQIFQIAGCLGRQFTAEILEVISCSLQQTKVDLTTEDSLSPAEAVHKLLAMHLFETSKADWMKFSHDRIQQAAESRLSDDEEKTRFHFEIGSILKKHFETQNAKHKDWLFFTAIDQINKGKRLVTTEREKLEVAKLNRLAAAKARKRSAFLPAAVYEDAAISLLGEKAWSNDPGAAMELYEAAATCYLACGRSDRSLEIAGRMLEHATRTQDIRRGQSLQLEAIEQQRRFDDGIELGMTMLRSLGERFPRKPNPLHVILGFLKIKRLLQKFTDHELLNLPAMSDEHEILISKMNDRVARILFFAKKKDVLPLLWFRHIEKSITFGMSAHSSAAFSAFASLLGHLNDHDGADRVGRLSLKLSEKFGSQSVVPMVHLYHYYFSHHWKSPVLTSIDPLMSAYTLAMKVGDVQLALMCAVSSCSTYLCCGLNLGYIEKDLCKFLGIMEDYNLRVITDVTIPVYQLVLNLTGTDQPQNPVNLSGRAMNEKSFFKELNDTGNVFGDFTATIMKLRACIFLGTGSEDAFLQYRRIRSKRFAKELRAHFGARQDDFYGALAAIGMFKQSGRGWYRRYARRIVRTMEIAVEKGAINCVHMLLILQAEMMTTTQMTTTHSKAIARQEVKRAFDKAINSAKRSGFCQDAGLANEKAATFHAESDEDYAEYYWQEAYNRYVDWGAGRKVEQMMELHGCLRKQGRADTNSSILSSGGRMNARSRYNETAAQQNKFLNFFKTDSKKEASYEDK